MFKERLISGIILIAVILALFIAGGDVLWFALIVISLIGINELRNVFDPMDRASSGDQSGNAAVQAQKSKGSFTVFFVPYMATMFYYTDLRTKVFPEFEILIALLVVALLFVYVSTYPRYHADQVMAALFSFFYVPFMLSYIYRTRQLPHGAYLVWLIILCSWGSDTCAYCVGVLFGKHKMTPVLSPKKSIEGAVGGVVGAMLVTWVYCMVFKGQMQLSLQATFIVAAIAGAGALISMIGDLAASAIKRNYDIKDYGTLIPGHGGILDRFDSVIITAPIIYYLCNMFVGTVK